MSVRSIAKRLVREILLTRPVYANPVRGSLASVAGCLLLVTAEFADSAPPPDVNVAQLVRQLGDPSFAAREAAQQELSRLPGAVVAPHLAAAAGSAEPEVRARVAAIIAHFDQLDQARLALRLGRFAERFEPDLFVEAVAGWKRQDDDPVWRGAYALGKRLIRTFNALQGLPHNQPFKKSIPPDFDRANDPYWQQVQVETADTAALTGEGPYLYRGGAVEIGDRAYVVAAIARHKVTVHPNSIRFAFTNGDITTPTDPKSVREFGRCAVLVCAGTFRAEAIHRDGKLIMPALFLKESLIVAAADVWLGEYAGLKDCVLLAGGDVHIGKGAKLHGVRIRAGGRVLKADTASLNLTKVEENLAEPLAPIRFFDLSRVGVAVATAGKSVSVTVVRPDSPLAPAGVVVGDVIVSIDGSKTETAEAARTALRAAYARGSGTITVRRGGTTRDLKVTFPDD